MLVKYEDLRADTLNVMRRTHPEIKTEIDEADLAWMAEAHPWEITPRRKKGKENRLLEEVYTGRTRMMALLSQNSSPLEG